MADAGPSSAPTSAPAGPTPVIPLDGEFLKKLMAAVTSYAESYHDAPLKDKKPQMKKKKETNKKIETAKKKSAEEKAKLAKTMKELKKLQLLETRKSAMARLEKRRSWIQKDEELIRTIDEKLAETTDQ